MGCVQKRGAHGVTFICASEEQAEYEREWREVAREADDWHRWRKWRMWRVLDGGKRGEE